MTTGTDNDFIGLAPSEGEKSIVEIAEIARKSGYSLLSDNEIDRLIEYREKKAEDNALLKIMKEESDERMRIFSESCEKQRQEAREVMRQILSIEPTFKSVKEDEL